MYRQIDKDRNRRAMAVEQFPPHIQKLLQDMRRKEEEDRINREKENDMIKINVYCHHPGTNTLQDVKISVFSDSTLAEAVQYAHQRFKLESYVDVEDCRIVIYNKKHDCVDCNFDSNEFKLCDIIHRINQIIIYDWLLEIKEPGK